jgi:hypothetical protein
MKVQVKFRWWVKPFLFVSSQLAVLAAFAVGGFEQETVDAMAERLGAFVGKYGVAVVELH